MCVINPKRLKRGIAWLLAVMVLGGSISPPAYRHAHAGGDVAHVHQSQLSQRQPHHHGHSHHGHPHHHHHATHDTDITAATAHSHVAIFGIEFTLPSSDEDNSDPSDPRHHDLLCDIHVPRVFTATEEDRLNTSATPPILPGGITCSPRWRAQVQWTVPFAFLCDIARHERSGVQRF